jgi:hypothetical protein
VLRSFFGEVCSLKGEIDRAENECHLLKRGEGVVD